MTVVKTDAEDLEGRVRAAVVDVLRAEPRDRREVVELLRRSLPEELDEADDWLEEIVAWDPLIVGFGERIGYAPVLFDGLVLCHRLTSADLAEGRVSLERSLGVLDWGVARGQLTLHGLSCEVDGPHLVGPNGWLNGGEVGDVLAFHRHGSDLVVERSPHLGGGEREAAAVVAAAQELGTEHGLELAPMMVDAIVADPSLFRRAVPPIAELLWSRGMERRRHAWGFSDWIWRPLFARGDDRGAALERALAAFEDGACVDLEPVGELADAALDDLFGMADGHDATTVAALVAVSSLSGTGRAVLGASLSERAGDPVTARQLLQEAWASAEPTGVGVRLADYAFWAGDFQQAASLAERVRSELVARVSRRLVGSLRDAARRTPRNTPCPCASGRKFKHCCLRGGGPPLSVYEHTALVRAKLAVAAGGIPFPGILGEQAAIDQARAFGEVAKLSPLLPEVERSILDAVLHEPVRVWEALEVSDGAVRLRSGEQTVHVEGVTAEPGDLAMARVLPEHRIMYGTMEAVEPDDAAAVADALGPDPRSADLEAALSFVGS